MFRVIVYPDHLKYRGPDQHKNVDVQVQPTGGTSEPRDGWQPRPIPQFRLPRGAFQYYFSFREGVSSAAAEAEGSAQWKAPIRYTPFPLALYGFGGFRAETTETQAGQEYFEGRSGWQPKPLPGNYRPQFRYLHSEVPEDDSAAPEAGGQHGWAPRKLDQYGKYNPIWQYLQNVGAETASGGTGDQFQVLWSYRTNYETRVLQLRQYQQNTGVSFDGPEAESVSLHGWTPKPLRGFQLPGRIPYSYWFSAPFAASAPTEESTALAWIPRPLTLSRLPRGLVYYIFQGVPRDTSVVVGGVTVGRVTGLENRPVHWPTIIR